MERFLSRASLAKLVGLLEEEKVWPSSQIPRTEHLEIFKSGWAAKHSLEDLLYETSSKSELFIRDTDRLTEFLESYGISYESRFERPQEGQDSVVGVRYVRAADAASFMIQIERLGFAVDPAPLVKCLRPAILKQAYVTSSELSVLWFEEQRHKSSPASIWVRDTAPKSSRSFSTVTGYRACALSDDDGVVALRVQSPNDQESLDADIWAKIELRGRHERPAEKSPLIVEDW